jgi:electron transport complex protein RnfG
MQPLRPIFHAGVLLGLFSVLALGLVALGFHGTKARIAANERTALLQSLATLVAGTGFDNDLLADTLTVTDLNLGTDQAVTLYRARKQGTPMAIVLPVLAPDGYNGTIHLLVAIQTDGTLAGVRVLSHRETPGLGDSIDDHRSGWILGFTGRSLENPREPSWKVQRDGGAFDQFTGATITPRAVVKAVYKALVFFQRNRGWLFE